LKIRKLHTVNSTNSYLKDWLKKENLINYTVVVANTQTQGRGQRGNSWLVEGGKNLTFSVLVKLPDFKTGRQFELNQAVSLGLLQVLKNYIPISLAPQIKWPNDIMAGGKKIAGILIENSLSGQQLKHSIVGIGLNVNQVVFSEALPNAGSLKSLVNKEFDLDKLLQEIILSIKTYCDRLMRNQSLTEEYLQNLYLYQLKATYKDLNNNKFTGKITGINTEGRLQIRKTNDTNKISLFGFKEITFIKDTQP